MYAIRSYYVFTELGASFPSMLALHRNTGGSSIPSIQAAMQSLVTGFSGISDEEKRFFRDYNVKNNDIFSRLNERMSMLDLLNRRVAEIRTVV